MYSDMTDRERISCYNERERRDRRIRAYWEAPGFRRSLPPCDGLIMTVRACFPVTMCHALPFADVLRRGATLKRSSGMASPLVLPFVAVLTGQEGR